MPPAPRPPAPSWARDDSALRPAVPTNRRSAALAALRSFADRAALARIREGRIRAVDWPDGLGATVAVGVGLVLLACLIALASGWLRGGELLVPSGGSVSVPLRVHWLLVVMLVVTVALGQTAVLHGPWWLTVVGSIVTVVVIGFYGLLGAGRVTGLVGPAVAVVLIVALVVVTAVRHRRAYAWWEFPVVLALCGGTVGAGIAALSAVQRSTGAEVVPSLTLGTVQTIGVLAYPAAIAAGTAAAELTVGIGLAAAGQLQRTSGRRLGPWVLAALALVLLVETAWRVAHLDPVRQGWSVVVPALVVIALVALVLAALLRAGRRSTPPVAAELPDELGGLALPLGALLVAGALPLLLIGVVYAVVVSLDPVGNATRGTADPVTAISELTYLGRVVLAVVLMILAIRLARRGRVARALLCGAIALTVTATSMRQLLGVTRWPIRFDPDVAGLLAGTAVLLLVGAAALTGRLGPRRVVPATALVLLCLLFALRRYLDDPVGSVLGYSGVGVVVFGLLWDLVTGSAWANGESRRFPRPTRVLLVLTNSALLAVVVAYTALTRDARLAVDDFVELGDQVLGVALLAAVLAVVVQAFVRDRELS